MKEEFRDLWYVTWDFLEVIEEMFPDEFEEAYEEYKKRVVKK